MSVGAGHLPCQAARLAGVPNLPDCDIEAFQATASLPAPFTPPCNTFQACLLYVENGTFPAFVGLLAWQAAALLGCAK
jgi:hypothetical protein